MVGTKKAPARQGQMLAAALEYAERGIGVLPLEGKAPIGYLAKRGVHDATTDPDTIREWWGIEPLANIGLVPPDGWAIIDIDPRNGGKETITELVNGHKIGSMVAKTGGGGQHIWLKGAPDRLPGKLGPGVDIKKAGKGYVVAPPSIHPETGKPYTWKTAFDLDQVQTWPKWLGIPIERLPAPAPSDLSKGQVRQMLKRIPADDYQDWLTVGMALKTGFGDKAFPLWVKWSHTASDAASEAECRKKWRSFRGSGVSTGTLVAMAGLNHPPPRLASEEFDPLDEEDLIQVEKEVIGIEAQGLDGVAMKAIPWAWRGYLAYGSMHCIAGEPSAGKSSFVAGLVARISRGQAWPDGTPMEGGPQKVLMVNGEEDLAATIAPRLANCGADLSMIHVVREEKEPFSLQDDAERVEILLKSDPTIRYLVVDPIGSYMHGKKQKGFDSWKDDHVRQVLHPWSVLSERYNLCFIFVAHFGKGKTAKAMHRVMGSQAFVALTRLAMVCTSAANYAGDDHARAFGAIKQNLGRMRPPLLYYIRPVGDDPDEAPVVEFGGHVQGVTDIEALIDYETDLQKREENPEGLPQRVVEYVTENPGQSMGDVAEGVGISRTSEGYRRVIHHLLDLGEIEYQREKGPTKFLYPRGFLGLIGN